MGHMLQKETYQRLQARLNRMPVGAPDSETLYQILKMLYTEEEAAVAAQMPQKPVKIEVLERITGKKRDELAGLLDSMANKGVVLDFNLAGASHYTLAPTVVGFFEFTMMRVRHDIDQKEMAKLLHEYMEDSDAFAKEVFQEETQIGRVLVQEETIAEVDYAEVLDYERATHLIEKSAKRAVSLCFCRHKNEHLGRACKNPQEVCLSLNIGSRYIIERGFGREIEKQEALDILQQSKENGLVQIADNIQNRISYICNCCGCCCDQLQALNIFGLSNPVVTSNFIASVSETNCTGCLKCVKRCPVNAIGVAFRSDGKRTKIAEVDESICLGCGVCPAACKFSAITMEKRTKRVITPKNTMERVITMAIERGRLQHLLFDDPTKYSHQLFGKALGVLLNLPPAKKLLAKEQIKSRFVEAMMGGMNLTSLKKFVGI
jgi:ferredoxin